MVCSYSKLSLFYGHAGLVNMPRTNKRLNSFESIPFLTCYHVVRRDFPDGSSWPVSVSRLIKHLGSPNDHLRQAKATLRLVIWNSGCRSSLVCISRQEKQIFSICLTELHASQKQSTGVPVQSVTTCARTSRGRNCWCRKTGHVLRSLPRTLTESIGVVPA